MPVLLAGIASVSGDPVVLLGMWKEARFPQICFLGTRRASLKFDTMICKSNVTNYLSVLFFLFPEVEDFEAFCVKPPSLQNRWDLVLPNLSSGKMH